MDSMVALKQVIPLDVCRWLVTEEATGFVVSVEGIEMVEEEEKETLFESGVCVCKIQTDKEGKVLGIKYTTPNVQKQLAPILTPILENQCLNSLITDIHNKGGIFIVD